MFYYLKDRDYIKPLFVFRTKFFYWNWQNIYPILFSKFYSLTTKIQSLIIVFLQKTPKYTSSSTYIQNSIFLFDKLSRIIVFRFPFMQIVPFVFQQSLIKIIVS
ncbi:hypothetical protein BHU11_05325 [Tannerella sp. oral taxon 808]|nr:hypothetical protein BHU11_05325 [Tannerella sp. oral taxon 808]